MSTRVTLEVSLSTLHVFLEDRIPAGWDRLRICSRQGPHNAEVVCGELIHESHSVSPNQFVTASLGNVGNAWKVIHVQLPGDSDWTPAFRLRHAAMAHAFRTAKRKAERTSPPGQGGDGGVLKAPG